MQTTLLAYDRSMKGTDYMYSEINANYEKALNKAEHTHLRTEAKEKGRVCILPAKLFIHRVSPTSSNYLKSQGKLSNRPKEWELLWLR